MRYPKQLYYPNAATGHHFKIKVLTHRKQKVLSGDNFSILDIGI